MRRTKIERKKEKQGEEATRTKRRYEEKPKQNQDCGKKSVSINSKMVFFGVCFATRPTSNGVETTPWILSTDPCDGCGKSCTSSVMLAPMAKLSIAFR